MKRKIIIIIVSIILVLISVSLYYTYAVDVSMDEVTGNVDLTYNINIKDTSGRSITVGAGKTKLFDIFLTNNNEGTINYALSYNGAPTEDITIAQVSTSINKVSDLITNNTTNQISLIIINDTDTEITYNIVPVTGYEKGGDLIVPSGYTLISDIYSFPVKLDNSGANTPDLVDGLIPVMYSGSNWVKASSENDDETYQWYDYDNKQWANAVLVSSTNRSTYKNADPGVTIPESDILAYYVWIPRYRYKVWNINKVMGTDSYNAQTTGIDIVFEPEKETNGTVKCTSYSFESPSSSANSPNETCSGSNGSYYTHPAFTFGDTQLRGIWVGKFEVSNSTSQIKIKPNVQSLRDTTVSAFSSAIQNMQASGNSYGLTTDRTKADSHMLKNMEWGAVAYLTNSDYGRCSNNSCTEVTINSNSSLYTGGNNYITNVGQSTTGNIYGIYDMSGGADEYVMGNVSSGSGSYTYNALSAGSNFTYSSTTAKYIDTYAYGSSTTSQAAYNRARLGDATSETAGWYSDYANFPRSPTAWFVRGGFYSAGSDAGLFGFNNYYGPADTHDGARSCLVGV